MNWTLEEIEGDWLAGSVTSLTAASEDVVNAFERVDRTLGRAWIDASRISGGTVVRGIAPVLRVVAMGQRLAALDGVPAAEELIRGVKRGDDSAEAELTRGPDSPVPPGVTEMRDRRADVTYTFEELPAGGRVRIATANSDALNAVRDFLNFQIADHHTGDKN